MTSPLINCIVSYAAVYATLNIYERYFNSLIVSYAAVYATLNIYERYFNSLTLNNKLAAG